MKTSPAVPLMFILFITVVVVHAANNCPTPEPSSPWPWVGFRLALLWSPGYCTITGNCDAAKIKDEFTIHGMWPFNETDQSPPIPAGAVPYDPALIVGDLRNALDEQWPNYESGKANEDFWAYEYNKHGVIDINGLAGAGRLLHGGIGSARHVRCKSVSYGGWHHSRSKWSAARQVLERGHVLGECHANLRCEVKAGTQELYLKEVWLCFDYSADLPKPCPSLLPDTCPGKFIYKSGM
ncbi:unnamed protein product [Cuscuta epithymum]|uniref:Uncharacterized protein n=1 Tax=Cuscuta epithymum TaxID=186058 RepID=A0AAV0DN70_9ASTE|nr:unnamed protein product [Cuscuta epithymum]CAH9139937.1 unnamed protein product [Cuscuta epithymum]